MVTAFSEAKTVLLAATHLSFPEETAELCLATGCQCGVAAAGRRPLGFFSQKLEKAQLAYSIFDRELFAIYAAIRHFRHQVEG